MRLRVVKNVEIRDAIKTPEGTNARRSPTARRSRWTPSPLLLASEPRCAWLDEKDAPRSPIDGGVLVDECASSVDATIRYSLSATRVRWRNARCRRLGFRCACGVRRRRRARSGQSRRGACDGEALGFNLSSSRTARRFSDSRLSFGVVQRRKLELNRERHRTYQRETLSENPEECQYVRVPPSRTHDGRRARGRDRSRGNV